VFRILIWGVAWNFVWGDKPTKAPVATRLIYGLLFFFCPKEFWHDGGLS